MNIKQLQKWFKTHIKDQGNPYTLDKDQAAIVLDNHLNTLVVARAGSGKTRTIVAKITYLVAHEHVPKNRIIVFAFNRKARAEINTRLSQITYDDKPIFAKKPSIATTFHAFAYNILGGKKVIGDSIIDEDYSFKLTSAIVKHYLKEDKTNLPKSLEKPEDLYKFIDQASQFITRAEQKFFKDYKVLKKKIDKEENPKNKHILEIFYQSLIVYHRYLEKYHLTNFNLMLAKSYKKIKKSHYKYIFIDEYQDFSLLFLTLIKKLRKNCENSHLLAVGDDWQAINRFAGSDVKYFKNFKRYFPTDSTRLFISTNYRSGKRIVENANYFMSKALRDHQGCKSGCKTKSKIHVKSVAHTNIPFELQIPRAMFGSSELLQQYYVAVRQIIIDNPKKSIKILSRNNDLSFKYWSLNRFCRFLELICTTTSVDLSFSTIHRSKGLEADIVILLEVDRDKFPTTDKSNGLYNVFGDTSKTLLDDERRLFYVAITRAKEQLFILTSTLPVPKYPSDYNFLDFLNPDWLNFIFS